MRYSGKNDVRFWRVRESDGVWLYNVKREQDFYGTAG